MSKPLFLKAKWENLLMLNYEVDPNVLSNHIPPGTELDLWEGKALVSMVGFMFADTSVLGIKWPFHINFEEVNLRFYVKYFNGNIWKRGAVFISEIVPKPAIAIIANQLYNEHYRALRMRHLIVPEPNGFTNYLYEWKLNGEWNTLGARVSNEFAPITPGTAEEFIFEHYWGYNGLNSNTSIEYQVEHVSWETAKVKDFVFDANVNELYGAAFEPYLKGKPHSVFFARGSEIGVRMGEKIKVK